MALKCQSIRTLPSSGAVASSRMPSATAWMPCFAAFRRLGPGGRGVPTSGCAYAPLRGVSRTQLGNASDSRTSRSGVARITVDVDPGSYGGTV